MLLLIGFTSQIFDMKNIYAYDLRFEVIFLELQDFFFLSRDKHGFCFRKNLTPTTTCMRNNRSATRRWVSLSQPPLCLLLHRWMFLYCDSGAGSPQPTRRQPSICQTHSSTHEVIMVSSLLIIWIDRSVSLCISLEYVQRNNEYVGSGDLHLLFFCDGKLDVIKSFPLLFQ